MGRVMSYSAQFITRLVVGKLGDALSAISTMMGRMVSERAQALGGSVTTTDLLKIIGVVSFLLDHIGLFFYPDQNWWRVFGHLAAPIFFFLVGFARSRSIPWSWVFFGTVLTALDVFVSWNRGLQDTNMNILFNFLLLRIALLPLMERITLQRSTAIRLG